MRFPDPWFNAHRLGKGLYGYTSQGLKNAEGWKLKAEEQEPKLQMVADVYSTVISTQQVSAWQWVGYGYQRVAHEDGQIATIPLWYAEWLTRAMAGQWNVRVQDPAQAGASVELPLVGAISMNYSSISDIDSMLSYGDTVHVISSNPEHSNNWHEMARINHTITRELLIKMDEKMRRVVI